MTKWTVTESADGDGHPTYEVRYGEDGRAHTFYRDHCSEAQLDERFEKTVRWRDSLIERTRAIAAMKHYLWGEL